MCWIKYKIEIDQTWWFSVSKPKKMSDVCLIFAACCVEFETENDQTWLFHFVNQKMYESHISALCRIAYELKNDQSWLFSLLKPETERWCMSHFCWVPNRVQGRVKPEKCTIYVTFLLRAERECEIKNDQSWLTSPLKPEKSTMYVTFCRVPTVREKNNQCCRFLLC